MKKILEISESNKQKQKEKEFIKFAKIANEKNQKYKYLLNTMPDLEKSNKSEIKKWYKDFVDLLFQ
jgi:hypothetical protein